MEEGVMRNKFQPVVSLKTGENLDGVKWSSRGFQASIAGVPVRFRQRGWQGNDGRLLSFRTVPSSAKTMAGNVRYGRVKVAGRVGSGLVSGSEIRSVDSFSLSLFYTCMCFLCFQLIPLLINSLTASYHITTTGVTERINHLNTLAGSWLHDNPSEKTFWK